MRKETQAIALAFKEGRKCHQARSSTDGETVWLHGHAIARWHDGHLQVRLAGYVTNTTCDRVNGVIEACGVRKRIFRKNYEPFIGAWGDSKGEPVSSVDWIDIPEAVRHA